MGKSEAGIAVLTAIGSPDLRHLLAIDPSLAETRARETLARAPRDPDALLLLGGALRCRGDAAAAKAILGPLTELHPEMAAALFELGLALGTLGDHREAFASLWRAADLRPGDADIWYALVDEWMLLEHDTSPNLDNVPPENDPQLQEAAAALRAGRPAIAETLLLEILNHRPTDVWANKLLADALLRMGRQGDAEALLARCLECVPNFQPARLRLAAVLFVRRKFRKAQPHIEKILVAHPAHPLGRAMKAAALAGSAHFAAGAAEYETFLKDNPTLPGVWLGYGRALRALGRQKACSDAFCRAIEIFPGFAEAYWNLAGVKSFRFGPALIDLLRTQTTRAGFSSDARAQLYFALGKALEDAAEYGESFECYRRSNEMLRAKVTYDAESRTRFVEQSRSVFTPAFFRDRAGVGCDASDPIFIVGMPRSGSTLIEQILSSHSAIEGAGELNAMFDIVIGLNEKKKTEGGVLRYPEDVKTLDADTLRSLGEEYLKLVRPRRSSERPFFTDKFPGNFVHIGLMHLILPRARIIDARRHPLDCGFSCFKSYFPFGQPFAHRLSDIGRYYADYVELMAHYDKVLPGKIHRVIYEHLVQDTEREVRRLFDYLELPFEDQCLRFYEKEREVITLSTEQVRMPIYQSAVEHWRHYEPWLGPLKSALGYILDRYPEVPEFYPRIRAGMSLRLVS